MHIEDHNYKKSNLIKDADKRYYHTINKFRIFAKDNPLTPKGKVVFAFGSFDLLNFAHIAFLEKAKAEGDYLIVGLFDDATINEIKGFNYPVLNVYSRALNLLSLKYVDDVVLNMPYKLTPDFITEFGIHEIVEGKTSYMLCEDPTVDCLELVRDIANIKKIDSGTDFRFDHLLTRIKNNEEMYAQALDNKKKKLAKYYEVRAENKVEELV